MKNNIKYRSGTVPCRLRFVHRLVITLAIFFLSTHAAIADSPISLPTNADGWTVFTPSANSRIIYVSNAGNDATGQSYSPGHPAVGANPFNPTGTINAFATYSAARQQARDGYPDWMLFRRGDTFSATIEERSGASDTEFALTGAYGPSGAMPIIHPVTQTTIPLNLDSSYASFSYFAVVGLDFYSHERDPDSGDYVGTSGNWGLWLWVDGGGTVSQVLIEGCKFRFFPGNNAATDKSGGAAIEDFVIRRCSILDDYSSGGDSHGFSAGSLDSILFEENILDHNGWYSRSGPGVPGIRNHNTYFNKCSNVTYRNNIITRASSMNTKMTSNTSGDAVNVTIEGNLWIGGEGAIDLGTNHIGSGEDTDRFWNLTVKDNVVTNIDYDGPTERGVAWGFLLYGIDTGEVSGNLLMNWNVPAARNRKSFNFGHGLVDVTIEDNIVYAPNDRNYIFRLDTIYSVSGNVVQNNVFQEPAEYDVVRMVLLPDSDNVTAFTFAGNIYYVNGSENFIVESTTYNFEDWVTVSGDTSSFETYNFPEPTRDIKSYMTHIGGQGTIDAFIKACRNQGRFSWDSRLMAANVNSWLRAGFWPVAGSPPLSPQAPSGLRVIN